MSRPSLHRALSALALLALAAALPGARSAPSPASPAAEPPEPGRPVVLVLPGRGLADADTAALRRDWLDALNLGLTAAGAWPLLADRDLRLVWYADALDPRAPATCADRAPGATPAGVHDFAATLSAALMVAAMVADLSEELDGEPLREVAGDLLYFGDDGKRCAAEERLEDAIAGAAREARPIVLVAHSFGSLVALGHLAARDPGAPRVERWITIGSLVGRPDLRELMLGPDARTTGLPPGVGSWVNVRAPDDVLAAPLGGVRTEELAAGRVVDTITAPAPPGDPHDAARYLADPVTAGAVLEAWCAEPGGAAAAEPACAPL